MRFILLSLSLPLLLAACGSGDDGVAEGAAVPTLAVMSEKPGDWTALDGMVGRRPAESGLIENSPISVDLDARLGEHAGRFRDAMMRAGPMVREGRLMVVRGPDSWLVIDPADHSFRAAMQDHGQLREWQTPGASLPAPTS